MTNDEYQSMSMRCCLFCVWVVSLGLLAGCRGPWGHHLAVGPPFDRPFPLGQVTDAHWETQQANAEASDFVLYDHEFQGETARLTPAGKKHLLQIALRMEQVPFPIVVEQSPDNRNPELDASRRAAVIEHLAQVGVETASPRVVVAPALAPGITAMEGEAAYYSTLHGTQGAGAFGGGYGRRFGGVGGFWR